MITTLKTCFKCQIGKPIEAFYKHPRMLDGHLNKCIDCAKKDVAAHRLANLDKIRAYDKRRSLLPHRITNRRLIVAQWAINHPDRYAANYMVHNYIRDGKLKRYPCFICGAKGVAHHPDYSRPLDVVWLCQAHHKQAHALLKKAA